MELFIKILMFITSLSLLVLIHELGHFLAARMFGVRVEKFYLFFNPWFSLVKIRIGETEFGIGWVPFGGYCKISGMIDESMDLEQMKEEPKPYEFRSKPAWQRLLIMTGGVIMNVVLALAIYIGMSYKWGDEYLANDDMIYGYVFNELGHEIGFRDGDRILKIGDQKVEDYNGLVLTMLLDAAPVEVLRGSEQLTVDITDEAIGKILALSESKKWLLAPRMPFVIGKLTENMPAAKAGILPGDSLVALNGQEMLLYDEYTTAFAEHKGGSVDLTVARDSAGTTIYKTLPVAITDEGTIGVMPFNLSRFFPIHTKQYGFLESFPAGFHKTGVEINNYWKQIKMIFKPETGAYKSLGGFMMIGSIFPGTWDWFEFWRLTAFLSIVLAIMNILPIPALDGGHVLFLLWEVVTGRKPSDKFMEYAQITGLMLLFALLLYANGNDIYRFFIKS